MANICIDCARTCLECEWLARLKPVKGWTAKKKKYKSGGYSYNVTECPKFKKAEAAKETMHICVCANCGRVFARNGRAYRYCCYHCQKAAADKQYWERL